MLGPEAKGENPVRKSLLSCGVDLGSRTRGEHLDNKSTLIIMMNTQHNENPYGVERISQADQLLPGSLPVGDQAGRGRQSVTGNTTAREKRKEWSRQDNINVMKCFYLSHPEKRGYMKRMLQIWKERRLFDITDQRIADQVRVVKRNGLMSTLDLVEVKNRVLNVLPSQVEIENNLVRQDEHTEETADDTIIEENRMREEP